MEPTVVTLIRHGESQAQVDGVCPRHLDCTGLSDAGKQQAARLRDRLVRSQELAEVTHVYTSVSARAKATAAMLSSAVPSVPHVESCGWCEMHAGSIEGMRWEEVRRLHPREDGDAENPFRRAIPGCESWADLYARAGERLRRLWVDHPGEHVAVVTHGGVIGASFVAYGDVPVNRAGGYVHEARNTSLTTWRRDGREVVLVRYNDAAHLIL